jgi:uncharacterized protein YaiI (UPF0178 family)
MGNVMTDAPLFKNMVERVARAMAANPPGEWYEERDGKTILARDLMPTARAAIEAMREPTEAMIEARFRTLGNGGQSEWQAMIDAALKE